MLSAILDDLNRVPGVRAVSLPGFDDEATFRKLCRWADYGLVIAPEFDGLLSNCCTRMLREGRRLLNSLPGASDLTADKYDLARVWRQFGVPTPPCLLLDGSVPAASQFPAVLKPRFGAGSQATCQVRRLADLPACLAAIAPETPGGGMLLQPFAAGAPVSVSFLAGKKQTIPLMPATQCLSADGRFRYLGGTLPLPPALAERAVNLGRRAVQVVPGLRGYIGVDLILGAADDGSEDYAIEINPRLTTSYIGLRALAVDNLAELMLRVVCGEAVAAPTWRPGPVYFSPAVATTATDADNGNGNEPPP